MFQFDRYLPLLDPEKFSDAAFYEELEKIGYRQVLLGGTGAADLAGVTRAIKARTGLTVVLYPAGPDSVTDAADVVVLPDVMNSNSHFARPFGSGSIATALNIAMKGVDYVPVAYFIMGNSTARWYFDAFLIRQPKLIFAYANYARMLRYPYLALDYEDPELDISEQVIRMLKQLEGMKLVVSDEFTPESAVRAAALGTDVIITPSDIYEDASDPLVLAAEFHSKLLRDA